MNPSAFCPPNTQHLSFDVIGSLPLRSALPQSKDANVYVHPSSKKISSGTWKPGEPLDYICRERNEADGMHRNTLPTVDGALFAELANWQHLSMQLRRKSRRETQRRYRKKQADHMVSLKKDVQQLQDEITKLQQRRVSTETASKVRRDIWNVALEYYATFRRVSTQDVGSHLKFLRETMAPDVASIDGFGPVNLAKSWSVWRWFDDVDVDLQALEKHGENAVVLTTRTSLKITERTLKNLFPHLYGDGEKNWVKASAVAKLVDQRIVVDGLTIFQWDCTANVMASVKARNDLVTPVFRLLGSLKEVSLVFDQALVSPDLHRRSIP